MFCLYFQTSINITEQKIFQGLYFMIKYICTHMYTSLWNLGILVFFFFMLLGVLVLSTTGGCRPCYAFLEHLDLVHSVLLLECLSLAFFCLVNTLSSFKRYQLPLEGTSDSPAEQDSFPGWSQVTSHIASLTLSCFLSAT